MERRNTARCGLALLALFVIQVPAWAQTAAATTTSDRPFHYDVSKEITLNASVTSVLKTPSRGMTMGSHLMLATSSGTVDASLGRFAFRGVNPLSVTAGEHVEITGVMKTINSRQVLLVRTVKVNNHLYTLRNQSGTPLMSHGRPPSPELIATRGGQR
jgi:hypothetical protein